MKANTSILLLSFFLSAFCSNAQGDLIDILTDETCKCISEPGFEEKDAEQMQLYLGICMIEKAMPYNDRIKSELGIDLLKDGEDGGRRLGEQIGIKLITVCPDFQIFLTKIIEEEELERDEMELQFGSFSGEITEFKNEGFMYIVVKQGDERPQKFLWFDYFNGSEDIIGNYDEHIGKQVEIEYQKTEVFLPEASDYFTLKKIVSLKLN